MVVAVHPERLAREAASAASTPETRDWMRPAERLVGAPPDEPGLPSSRCQMVNAVAIRTEGWHEHRAPFLSRPPPGGPAGAVTPREWAGCTEKPTKCADASARIPDSATSR